MNGKMSDNEIVISFSIFEATDVKTYHFSHTDYDAGIAAAKEILTDRTKACIVFSEGLSSDSESFLNGFSTVNKEVVIAGGNAADNHLFKQSHIINGTNLYDVGTVIAVIDSDILHVHNSYSLEWTPVGKFMSVTKADKNIIYEIDNKPVCDVYSQYLGSETVKRIPVSAIEFPLVKIDDNVKIARSIIAQNEDGGFVYAGHFKEGDKVRYAIGNVEEVLNNAVNLQNEVASKSVEASFIYSCSVRKMFLDSQLNYEFGLINDIAPTAGLFTYGEYFHSSNGTKLLNITTTVLSLSESTNTAYTKKDNRSEYKHTMLKSLTHLVNETQKELDDTIKVLDQYKVALDESSIVLKVDPKFDITYVNDTMCKVSGYDRSDLLGAKFTSLLHKDNSKDVIDSMFEKIKEEEIWRGSIEHIKKDGDKYYTQTTVVPIFDQSSITEYVVTQADVSELILKDEIINRQLADSLTGLKNRVALINDLEVKKSDSILLLFNIDRFSEINDYFGYDVGNAVLIELATRIKHLANHHHVYRLSADEFAILCLERDYNDKLKQHVKDIIEKLQKQKYHVDKYDISIGLSCGVAYAKNSEVYKLTHIALKHSQDENIDVVFYNDNKKLSEATSNNIKMIDKIKSAIDSDLIVPFFQGIVDNNTQKIVKYESLMRLIDSDGTVLTPFWFLEHAKKAKLYDTLSQIMIKKTFEMFENEEYGFSFNLTLQDILSNKTSELLFSTLKNSPASNRAVLEIVESEGIENFDVVIDFINRVREYGCKIAIDDFGSGYSNFGYLSKLNVDFIKIDGSLIKNIDTDIDQQLTVESILLFARKKGIKTIAEFVEDENIYNKLVELGVDYSQGYYFSKPSKKVVFKIPCQQSDNS